MVHNILYIAILFLGIPSIVSADIFISEIMYDQEGTDSKREWVEVYNAGSEISDFTQYKFFENEVYHGIKEFEGGIVLPSDSYAIIADNPLEILSQIPDGVIVFDSAFSLSNNGEVIALTDGDKNILDEVFYDVELGAQGDGNTLQKDGAVWVAATPSIGFGLEVQTSHGESNNSSQDHKEVIPTTSGAAAKPIIQDPFTIEIIEPESIFVGEIAVFEARAFDSQGDDINFDRFSWNFGDGTQALGKRVTHVYQNEGEYIVYADGTYSVNFDSDKERVSVVHIPVEIEIEMGHIIFYNNSTKEFDLSGWILMGSDQSIRIPEHTYMLPKSRLIFNSLIGEDIVIFSASGQEIEVQQDTGKDVVVSSNSGVEKSYQSTKVVEEADTSDYFVSEPLNISADVSKSSFDYWWIVLLVLSICFGLGVLYFSQKKTTLIDEIEILD